MTKLPLHTPDLTNKNYAALAALFPNAVTETIDENGAVVRAIDADILAQEINTRVVSGKEERYQFTWPDKKKAILLANSPVAATLRPCREESVIFDNTENLYIEGDNLDVLKLLRETYLNRVKMIYIDPPYNTGSDFVYNDDFTEDTENFLSRDNQYDDSGNRMVRNLDSNGRFHTDWLNMIYPRLRIARDLLADNGVIFISIDDNEVFQLRKFCDEIFGEGNFIAQIIWKKRSTPPNDKIIGAAHEYVVSYAKKINEVWLNLRERSDEQLARYKNPDNHPKGPWTAGDLGANIKGGRYVESLYFPIINPNTGEENYPPQNGNWRFSKDTINKLLLNNEIFFGEDGKGRPKLKRFLNEVKSGITYTSIWDFVPLNMQGSTEMTEILGNIAIFDNPKPIGLIKELCKLGGKSDSIILDFFSGSATTAHAVMQLNAEDGGKRKFIMVQLPEVCDKDSEAAKAGYKNICEIGKERIRRAGTKIVAGCQNPDTIVQLPLAPNHSPDIGFRVLKLDTSNMKDVYYTPQETVSASGALEVDLDGFIDNIKPDRTPEDLLFQVMLDLGILLSAKIEVKQIDSKTVYFVNPASSDHSSLDNNHYLIACFDLVTTEIVTEIAKTKPYYAVFRDSSFYDDSTLVNFEQIFKTYSPSTIRKVL